MEWFRWYHGTVADPKFTVIAKRAQQPRHVVIACWTAILEHASTRSDRGCLEEIDHEEIAASLDLETEQVEAVYQAMVGKGMIVGDRLKSWEKRQPKREDSTGAERKERWRKKKSEGLEPSGTHGNACGTQENETERLERARTEQNRTEERREEEKPATTEEMPPPPPQPKPGGRAGETASQQAVREAVKGREAFIQKHWPTVDIALETERMVAKARDKPVLDPVQFVLAWFPRAKPARAVLSVDQVEEHDRRAAAEFLGQEVSSG